MALMSQADYARQRGVTRQAVSKAVKDGRIRTVRDRIDPEAADRDWPKPPEPLVENPDDLAFAELRRQRELVKLRMDRLAHLERCRQLVEVAAVRAAVTRSTRIVRDRLLALPVRVAADLVGRNEREIASALDAAIQDVLDDLGKGTVDALDRVAERR